MGTPPMAYAQFLPWGWENQINRNCQVGKDRAVFKGMCDSIHVGLPKR